VVAEQPGVHATPHAVTVDRITHVDVPAICGLYKKVWDAHPPGLPPELVKSWQPTQLEFTSWMEGVTYFGARRDGRLVGAVGCEIRRGSCRLVNLAVDPEARRQGVGSALLASAVDWARHSGSPVVWVDALAKFTTARALFQKIGFVEVGTLHKHEWAEDVRLFEKLL
jgi:GNAT superfamily N-acetyltransferase